MVSASNIKLQLISNGIEGGGRKGGDNGSDPELNCRANEGGKVGETGGVNGGGDSGGGKGGGGDGGGGEGEGGDGGETGGVNGGAGGGGKIGGTNGGEYGGGEIGGGDKGGNVGLKFRNNSNPRAP